MSIRTLQMKLATCHVLGHWAKGLRIKKRDFHVGVIFLGFGHLDYISSCLSFCFVSCFLGKKYECACVCVYIYIHLYL